MWIFKRRKREPEALDQTGPATSYPHKTGAIAAPSDPPASKTSDQKRNTSSHIPSVSPLITPGQLTGLDDDQ